MKKLLSLVLIGILLLGCFAGCSGKNTEGQYTLRAAVTTYLGSWEPIWYDNPQEKAVAKLLNCPLWESVIADTKTGAYQWVFLGAESLEDVTETCQADLAKYGGKSVFEIRLRKEMCWDDGACIDADTYLYSLDMLVRSHTRLVEGVGALAGAKDYSCTEHVFTEKVGCYAVDDYTLRYVCQEKTTKQELMLALAEPFLLKPSVHQANIYAYCSRLEYTASCGPYRLVEDYAGTLTLEQNARYWEYRKENGRLVSTTSFQVDGKNLPQYQTTTIIITQMTEAEAKQAYLEGKIDYWDAGEAESISLLTNEDLYRKGQSFVLRLFFNTRNLKNCDAEYGNKNSIVLSSEKFRKAMSLAFDRADWVTATEGYAPALGLINDLSYYNETSQYRDSLAGKEALCGLYGVDAAAYSTLTGYDLTQAKTLMEESCRELVAAGLYKAGENIHIRIAWKNGQLTQEDKAQAALLEKYLQAAMEGSGFGKLTLEAVDGGGNRYNAVTNGRFAIGLGAWGGNVFDPYSVMQLYCNASAYERGCWDPAKEKLTLTVNGEEMKKTWAWWAENLCDDGELDSLDEATRLELLATLEQKLLEKYYTIPLASIESMMTYRVDGPTIHCSLNQGLKDHDWLTMRLAVTEEMFPQPIAKKWSMGNDDVVMYALAALALVYWLVALRSLPPKRIRRATAPEGFTAGELGCVLCGTGVDLTAMVLSWAQMGYLLIHVQDSGRVLLHRRMDMGNERSDLENKLFRSLFGRRSSVDGTGYHYAQLCQKASRIVSSRQYTYRRGSGSIRVFRVLCAGVGFLGGICLATAFVSDTALRVLLSGLLGVVGSFCAWQIQNAGSAFFLRKKLPLLVALGCSLLWLLLCAWADEWIVAAFLLVTQWLAGLAAAFGGRRTDAGKQTAAHILGLRRHLCSVPKAQLQQILTRNPDYFYALAPYALALGVDKAFARCFGSRQIPGCDYLTTGMDGHMTPWEWNRLLRDAVAALDERQQKLPLDRFLKR